MRVKTVFVLLFGLLLLGCAAKETEEAKNQNGEDEPAQQNQPAENDELKVSVKSWEETQELVADKRGKVVVIDLWAYW